MDLLRNLFGNLTSGIIRLAVTAGILFLVYLFLLKPVLDTTTEVIHSTGLDRVGKSLEGMSTEIKREVHRSFEVTRLGCPQAEADPLHSAGERRRQAHRTLH